MSRRVDVHVGRRLKFLREEKGLSCSDLEVFLNISAGSVKKFEDGSVMMKANELFQIAGILRTTIGFFYKDDLTEIEKVTMNRPPILLPIQ